MVYRVGGVVGEAVGEAADHRQPTSFVFDVGLAESETLGQLL